MIDPITPTALKDLLDNRVPMKVLDVRLEKDRTPIDHPIPGAEWRNPEAVNRWIAELSSSETVVVYCVHGHRVSQGVCAALRAAGIEARYLEEGIVGWEELIRSGITGDDQ